MSREDHDRLGTADLVAGAEQRQEPAQEMQRPQEPQRPDEAATQQQRMQATTETQSATAGHSQEQLAALFPSEMSAEFRDRWDQVQIGFVDDPRRAVQQADELVAEVMKSLAASFADQRSRLEAGLSQGGQADTEGLRVALQSYRSFFQRLLSL